MEQKLAGMDFQTADKQKHGGAVRDRDTIRASIMDESAIVCIFSFMVRSKLPYDLRFLVFWQVFSTLSFSGSSLFTKLSRNFDMVVIDEAAQVVSSSGH